MTKNSASAKKTVLIVDDERALVETIAEYLSQYRDFFDVITAENGVEALTILQSRPVAVLVTDIQMPEMDGVALLSHVMSDFPTIPCVVITAYGTPELEERLNQFGTLGMLEKPFDLSLLRKMIVKALEAGEQNSLNAISLEAFLQILEMEHQSAILEVLSKATGEIGYLYVSHGELVDASFRQFHGEEAVWEIIALPRSETTIKAHLREVDRRRVISNKLTHVLMEGTRRLDEKKNVEIQKMSKERSLEMTTKTTSEIFEKMLEIPGLQAVVVIAKDGFVIEMAGSARNVDLDGLGASLALIFNGIEQMGNDLHLKSFHVLTVEYGDALIVCEPVGDAVLAMVAPDSTTLGMIRFKSKKLVEELGTFF